MVTYNACDKFLLAKLIKKVLRRVNFTNLKTLDDYITKSKPSMFATNQTVDYAFQPKKQSYIHCTPKAKIVSRKNNCLSVFSQWYGCVHTESQKSGICSTIGCGNNRPYYELAPSLSLCKWDSGLWLHTVSCPSTERTTRIVTWLIKDKRIRSII